MGITERIIVGLMSNFGIKYLKKYLISNFFLIKKLKKKTKKA